MKIVWLTQGGFLFESQGYRLVVDPYMSDSLEGKLTRLVSFPLSLQDLRPNVVFCTHDHMDHLDPDTIRMIAGHYPSCMFCGPAQAFQHLKRLLIPSVKLMKPGITGVFGPWSVTPMFALHGDPSAVGYLFIAENYRIYLTGDTECDDRLFVLKSLDIDLLLICINGRLGNMNWEQALLTAKMLRPKIALPMHYGLFAENTENPRPFIEGCIAAGIQSYEMTPGKEFCAV
jgi:L-ascorbate metabolism protein UlaG (beta-lactamase superfamily)